MQWYHMCWHCEICPFYAKTILLRMFATGDTFLSTPVTHRVCIPVRVSSCFKKCVIESVVTLLLNSHLVISQVICSMKSTVFVEYVQYLLVCSPLLLTAELLHRKLCFTITFPPFICPYFNSLSN